MISQLLSSPQHLQPAVQGVFGLVVGSFLALISVRLPRSEPVVGGRSICRACSKPLRVWELIPVISWVIQRGKCHSCKSEISPRYPAIEFGCAGLGIWAGYWAPGWGGLMGALLVWQLVLIAVIDAEHFWLPRVLTVPLTASGLLAAWLIEPGELSSRLIGAAVGFASLWILAWSYRRLRGREGLGGGDPHLFAGVGAWLGWFALPTVLVWGCLAGLAMVICQLALRRVTHLETRLPFGSFLAIGAWITWLWGPLGGAP